MVRMSLSCYLGYYFAHFDVVHFFDHICLFDVVYANSMSIKLPFKLPLKCPLKQIFPI